MNPVDAIAPSLYQRITGFERLTDFFGYWPGFHDAEILSLSLERGGPAAILRLHTFAWEQEAVGGRTILTHHCTVEFRFMEVEDLHLADFDARNVISELRLTADGRESPPRWLVAFPAVRGLAGSFSCGGVEVVGVTPGIPRGSIYEP